jgi:hypothetical protein
VAWLLGNDQSPNSGQAAIDMISRQGRSTCQPLLISSLTTYATPVTTGASSARASAAGSVRRVHASAANNTTNTATSASVSTVASSRNHGGQSAAKVTMSRYHLALMSGTSSTLSMRSTL